MSTRTTADRLTGKPYHYVDYLIVTDEKTGLHTVGRWNKDRQTVRFLHPSRLTPAKFAELNPGKVQPDCGNLHDLHPSLYDRKPEPANQ